MRKLHILGRSAPALATVLALMTGCAALQSVTSATAAQDNEQYAVDLAVNGVSVNIVRDGKTISWGSGMFVGRSRVLTAAHVVDGLSIGDEIIIEHLSWRAKGHIEAIGDRAAHDAAIVALDTPLGGPFVASPKLCKADPQIGTRLAVVTANGTELTYGAPVDVRERAGSAGTATTTTWFGPGASGSAVVDIERRCLVGVVSQSSRTAGAIGKDGKTIESVDQKTLMADVPVIKSVVAKLPSSAATGFLDQ
jgi:hypothetical protein